MLLGMAETNLEATQMVTIGQKERPPPQLYTGFSNINKVLYWIFQVRCPLLSICM